MTRIALPIDEVLAELLGQLRRVGSAVLIAPPGAGKTTRVPPALLQAGLAGDRTVYVLEPRRLAARMAAVRVAEELGQEVGQTVGYEVRFERRVSAMTRIRFVTEGVLLRKLSVDPRLADGGAVMVDEFHERHLASDLSLSLVRALRDSARPDLCVTVMSATMDPHPVADFLRQGEVPCPIVESRGRAYPVAIEYAGESRGRDVLPLERRVAAAVRDVCARGLNGDVLVFLPGASEIRRAMDACTDVARLYDLEILPLHGDLPAAAQDRAVRRSSRRKVILATNVAETSITIDGVVCVVDSGLARVARHSPWSGLPSLAVEPISQASATQRAGRAGRTQPGMCIRLYHQHDHDTRQLFDAPEVARADLADAALLLHASGIRHPGDFAWYERPPEASMGAAERLLALLGAVDERGALTDTGRRMLRFPVHPRQARMLAAAEDRGVARAACTLVALLGQRELRLHRRTGMSGERAHARVTGPSDLIEDMDALAAAGQRVGAGDMRSQGLDPSVATATRRMSERLVRLCRADATTGAGRKRDAAALDEALLAVTLAGYPDRVARRRAPGSDALLLAGGGSAILAPSSVVTEAAFLVALDAEQRGRGRDARVLVSRASAIEPAWLLEEPYIAQVTERDEFSWNPERTRVERVSEMAYLGLVIDQARDARAARDEPERSAEILAESAWRAGWERFIDRAALAAWRARVAFVTGALGPAAEEYELRVPADEDLRQVLVQACYGLTSFAELERISVMDAVVTSTGGGRGARGLVERLAPTHIALPGRKRVPVHYELDRSPWIESRLQDFFGLRVGPTVADGRVALVLHLLAPNQRAVQVTSDLAGFWTRHYPAIRRELMRRYPKHKWPEDPLAVSARPAR